MVRSYPWCLIGFCNVKNLMLIIIKSDYRGDVRGKISVLMGPEIDLL